ncbi:MAG: hypothetical protein QXS20_04935 [Candidatus Thorarchaeota archaeon]
MAFGLLHYTFLVTGVIVTVCVLVLLKRYFSQKNTMTLAFTAFMAIYMTGLLTYASRGLFDLQSAGDILLWRIGIALTGIMGVTLSIYFAYPTMKTKASVWRSRYSAFVLITSIVFLGIFLTLPFVCDASHTYTDSYGLSHYRLEQVVPFAYEIVIGAALITVLYVAIFLFVAMRNESDPFYRLRALQLLVGWLAITLGQALLLHPTLSILHPVVAVIGALLLVHAVVRTKK